MISAARAHSKPRAMVGPSDVVEVRSDVPMETYQFHGKEKCNVDAYCEIKHLKGGDVEYNAGVIRILLGGKKHEKFASIHPGVVHTVALNAGATLYVAGIATSIESGFKIALEAIESGNCADTLSHWVATCDKLMTRG